MEKKKEGISQELGITVPGKNLGKQLIEAAEDKFRKERGEQVVEHVAKLMKDLETARNWERINRESAVMIEKKIQAIRDGKFTITSDREVVFADDSLNKPYPENHGFGRF